MTMIQNRTGSTLGDYEELTSFDEQLVSQHTPARDVSNLDLRQVLAGFDIALTEPMAPLRSFLATHVQETGASISHVGNDVVTTFVVGLLAMVMDPTFELRTVVATPVLANEVAPEELSGSAEPGFSSDAEDVVAAIKGLSWRLGLPQRDICKAADVSRSAYYTWNRPDAPRPRVSSQGRLWALLQFTEDLEDMLDAPPSQWLLARPERLEQLLDGRFDDLLESLRAKPQASQAAPDYALFLSVGGDRLASDAEPAALRQKIRRSASAQNVSRSRRRKK